MFPHLNLAAARRSRPEGRRISRPGRGVTKTGEEPRQKRDDNVRTIFAGRAARRRDALRWPCCRPGDFARQCRPDGQGRAEGLRGYRASRLHGFPGHGQHAQAGGRCLPRQADRGQSPRRARRLDRRPHSLHADRGLPLRQRHRRRLGGQGEFLAARRGPDRLCRVVLRHRVRRERALCRQRHRQHLAHHRRQDARYVARSPRSCSPTSCRRPAASRPMSPPAITPSSSCCGART